MRKILFLLLSFLLITSPVWAATELDYMEYATNAAAQAAYPSSDATVAITQQQTTGNLDASFSWDSLTASAQGFKVATPGEFTKFIWKLKQYAGGETGTLTGYIYSDNAGSPNSLLATFSSIAVNSMTTSYADYTFTGSFMPTPAVQYHMVIEWTGGTAGNVIYVACAVGGYADGFLNNGTIGSWTQYATLDFYFYLYQNNALQSYSEATIKQQGTYSLKGIAIATNSLNDTLTRTVSPTINLTGVNTVKFGIYASRTGSNIKIGIHDSGGTTTEKTHAISDANTWETDTWDISGVSDANKDVINSIIVTVTNADADNTFYIDNMYGETAARRIIMVN